MFEVAISPCPNDTFLFHAWVEGRVGPPMRPIFGDIQQLNEWALEGKYPVMKVSFAVVPKLQGYSVLPVGAALGRGCGPLIVAKESVDLKALSEMRVGVPGRETTAHLLLKKLAPEPKEKVFCLYHEMFDLLERGEIDGGVIIHEQRFTYEKRGFSLVADLGELWEKPIPLGGLVARPGMEWVSDVLQESLRMAWEDPERSQDYVLEHSQEKDPNIVRKHIETYVTEETMELSEEGREAIKNLCV